MLNRNSNLANLVASDMDKIIADDDHKKLFHKTAIKPNPSPCDCSKDCDCKGDCLGRCECKNKTNAADLVASLISLSRVFEDLGFEKSAASAMEAADCLISEAQGRGEEFRSEHERYLSEALDPATAPTMPGSELEEGAPTTTSWSPPELGDNTMLLDELGLEPTTEEGEEFADTVSDQIASEIFDEYPELRDKTRARLEAHEGIADEDIEGVAPETYVDEMVGETLRSPEMPSAEERHTLPYQFEGGESERGITGETMVPGGELADVEPEEVDELIEQIQLANSELDNWLKKKGFSLDDDDSGVGGMPDVGMACGPDVDMACGPDVDMVDAADLSEDPLDREIEEAEEDPEDLKSVLEMQKPWETFEDEE